MLFFSQRSQKVSKTIFYAHKFQTPEKDIPEEIRQRIARIRLAEHFPGWTFEYIDGLDPFVVADIWGVIDADTKIKQDRARQAQQSGRRGGWFRRGRKR